MRKKTLLITFLIIGLLVAGCAKTATQTPQDVKIAPVVEDVEEIQETKSSPVIEEEKVVEEPKGEVKEFDMIAKKWDFQPSTITVNKGDTVKLHIKSIDINHGFALLNFGINEVLRPGETVDVEFVADKAGTFRYSCSVPCGAGHSTMQGTLIVK